MTKTIGVQDDTYERLDESRSTGQSFDGKIQELLNQEDKVSAEATA
ncbi:MAG: antitoxin VapB family protein [Candidatus Paceibacteria bacterium]